MQIELGGQGQIVQIDESLFRHKPKVCSPQNCQFKTHAYNYIYIAIGQGKDNLNSSLLQNHRGRATRNEVRVFGLCDPSTQPALGYMQIYSAMPVVDDVMRRLQRHVRKWLRVRSFRESFSAMTSESYKQLRSYRAASECVGVYLN